MQRVGDKRNSHGVGALEQEKIKILRVYSFYFIVL
jgi:hypothetical protein